MMSPERIRELCRLIRERRAEVADGLLSEIEDDVTQYRTYLTGEQTRTPPEKIGEVLPLMGWLLLEVSLARLWDVPADWENLPAEKRSEVDHAVEQIQRATNAARRLPWPHYAVRALGTIRCAALVASKRDTEFGYDDAWILHQEARLKHQSFADTHGSAGAERYLRDLDEMLLQLALAETGTSCRTAERVVGRWIEGKEQDRDRPWTEADGPRWTSQMFRRLSDAADLGDRALRAAEQVEERWGFTHHVDEERMALPTSYRLPAIMTGRALLLMYTLSPAMEHLGLFPTGGAKTWPEARQSFLERFRTVYGYIEREARRENGDQWHLLLEHERSVVQLRLHLALIAPGTILSSGLHFDPCVELEVLDSEAVDALSEWLGTYSKTRGQIRGDANLIGCGTKPDFIASVERLRRTAGAETDYRSWRRRWQILDRYRDEKERANRVERAFQEADTAFQKPLI
ncbi:hypothetical protein PSN13_01428 [Micromonospora saelicesensis]|uniref:Uncharacterized protein n=1 Tax=Micromonospora saelicesensis TaxID=285676 RepID=A0A328NQZ2_9ACTN|nr:hypothetical protein [Micromonospora saelicesensis]RAO37446.1 hypothetical protein PSN13_01428 [Micromonospora saelicesensis]